MGVLRRAPTPSIIMESLRPDRDFVKKLKVISSQLEVEWSASIERWVIWYYGADGGWYRIHEVKNPDGSFRPLDDRVLTMLRRCDMSSKIKDPAYLISKQLRQAKEEVLQEKQRGRDAALQRSKQAGSKWTAAIANAEKGIFTDRQLGRQAIYSFSKDLRKVNAGLLRKLGKPQLTGNVVSINP